MKRRSFYRCRDTRPSLISSRSAGCWGSNSIKETFWSRSGFWRRWEEEESGKQGCLRPRTCSNWPVTSSGSPESKTRFRFIGRKSMRTRTRHNKVEFRRWSWRRIRSYASGWSSGGRRSGLGDKSSAPPVNPGHHGFGSEVIRNNRPVRPSKSAMRFQRAAQRRSGLTPPAMDNTGAHVVKIRAKWSPQNMYVIDGKALSLDGFVWHCLVQTGCGS